MKASRTQAMGSKTQSKVKDRFVRTRVDGKHPSYDYSFRQRDPENLEKSIQYGWFPVNERTKQGETWGSPFNNDEALKYSKTAGLGEIHLEDTMLFKRPKAASQYFKQLEDKKYNAQISLVNGASERIKHQLRELDGQAVVTDTSTKFTQRKGVNDDVGADSAEDLYS